MNHLPASRRTRYRRFSVATIAAFLLVAGPALAAAADPTDTVDPSSTAEATAAATAPVAEPSTSTQAQKLWLAAQKKAEILNEQVLLAEQNVNSAKKAATAAAAQVAEADAAVTKAQSTVAAADDVVAGLQTQLDQFASASFRGARLGQLSALLTAESAEDYLDDATSLGRVADNTANLMGQSQAARDAAVQARATVQAQQTLALTAKTTADRKQVEAVAAQTALTGSKKDMDAQVKEYRTLFGQLTEKERLAAIKAEEERLAREAAEARKAIADQLAAAQSAAVAAGAGKATPSDQIGSVDTNTAGGAAVAAALSKVGLPYVWGATGPDVFDCSGLTMWAWAQAGVSIPRTSSEQSTLPSVPLDQLQPGDLVTYGSPVHHVGMYIGNGQVVHASTESMPIYVTDVYGAGELPTGHRPG